ncbi:ECF transporter S component [Lactobacillaceae bacterium L1_55_11]|nr:ECF transporter S component [Lactobacillaceae bacterium L1_55_11]
MRKRPHRLVITTLFMAIIIIQTLVPWLGSLPLGAFFVGASVTLLPATVAIGAIILGPRTGAFLGGFWGLMSWLNALTHPGTIGALMFANPLTAFIPRIMVGWIVGYLFARFLAPKKALTQTSGLALLGALAAFINTSMVVLLTTISFTLVPVNFNGVPRHGILPWLLGILSFNAIFEIIASGILVMVISLALRPVVSRFSLKN